MSTISTQTAVAITIIAATTAADIDAGDAWSDLGHCSCEQEGLECEGHRTHGRRDLLEVFASIIERFEPEGGYPAEQEAEMKIYAAAYADRVEKLGGFVCSCTDDDRTCLREGIDGWVFEDLNTRFDLA